MTDVDFVSVLAQLSLPADLVNVSFSYEKLLARQIDETAVLSHLSRFLEDIKLLQDKCGAKMEEFIVSKARPPVKKLKRDYQQDEISVTDNITELDSSLTQVKAPKAEIDRRISAFIQRKRVEVDLLNKREFCNVVDTENNNEFRCARTDAVFVHRLGQKSHIKVTRVEDTNTTSEAQALGPEISTLSSPRLETRSCPGIEERLRNIETHLGYRPGRPVPCDVYKRLADLEEKVLHLEGISPEYFTLNSQNIIHGVDASREGTDSTQDLSIDAIDQRIRTLRHSLSKGLETKMY